MAEAQGWAGLTSAGCQSHQVCANPPGTPKPSPKPQTQHQPVPREGSRPLIFRAPDHWGMAAISGDKREKSTLQLWGEGDTNHFQCWASP